MSVRSISPLVCKRQVWLQHAAGLTDGLLQNPAGPHLCAAGEVVKQELKAKLPPVVTVDLQTIGVVIELQRILTISEAAAMAFQPIAAMLALPDQPHLPHGLLGCKQSSEHNGTALCSLRTASPSCPSCRLRWRQHEDSC